MVYNIYRLIHLWFKIQEIFPEGVAYQVNKRVRIHEFVYKICKSRGKYFLYFLTKGRLIYILHLQKRPFLPFVTSL